MNTETKNIFLDKVLIAVGIMGLLLIFLMVYVFLNPQLFLSNSAHIGGSLELFGIKNHTIGAQFVAMFFWSIMAIFSGALWTRAVFRTSTITKTSVISLTFSLFIIILSSFFVSFKNTPYFFDYGTNESAIVFLTSFAFVGFLLLIAREIITTMFSINTKK